MEFCAILRPKASMALYMCNKHMWDFLNQNLNLKQNKTETKLKIIC